jgi:hypothetical protein
MYFYGEKRIKDFAPYLAYLQHYRSDDLTLGQAIEIAERIHYTIETLEQEGHTFNETEVYLQEIKEYFAVQEE